MRPNVLSLFIPSVLFCTVLSSPSEQPEVHNANHVFNAIHSSMRQWGSSLNHNGMSFFLATVPASTQLYHGTYTPEEIRGMEWLAFEPEHALIFAAPRRPLNAPQHHGDEPEDDKKNQESRQPLRTDRPSPNLHLGSPSNHLEPLMLSRPHHQSQSQNSQQYPLRARTNSSEQTPGVGYLHTYVSKHNLHLLYIDGLSAGKTSNGTLDTQDMLLLNMSSHPMAGELERAKGLCDLASSLWKGKIDGILRMEGGFEIILCNFRSHVERTSVIAVTGFVGHDGRDGLLGGWPYIKAVTQRYNGIGGGRVRLDYGDFVSVFAYPDIDGLFDNDVQSDYIMPRLQNVSDADRSRVRSDITRMILNKNWDNDTHSWNWQSTADMVVKRYSSPLHYLHTNKQIRMDKSALDIYITNLLTPFIDSTARDALLERQRYISQLMPVTKSPSTSSKGLAHLTLLAISQRICDTLLRSLSVVSAATPHLSTTTVYAAHAVELIDNLVEYLSWTTWKECGTCPDEEICYIPIWPVGNHEDHENPRCMGEETAGYRWEYWGSPRPPRKE